MGAGLSWRSVVATPPWSRGWSGSTRSWAGSSGSVPSGRSKAMHVNRQQGGASRRGRGPDRRGDARPGDLVRLEPAMRCRPTAGSSSATAWRSTNPASAANRCPSPRARGCHRRRRPRSALLDALRGHLPAAGTCWGRWWRRPTPRATGRSGTWPPPRPGWRRGLAHPDRSGRGRERAGGRGDGSAPRHRSPSGVGRGQPRGRRCRGFRCWPHGQLSAARLSGGACPNPRRSSSVG